MWYFELRNISLKGNISLFLYKLFAFLVEWVLNKSVINAQIQDITDKLNELVIPVVVKLFENFQWLFVVFNEKICVVDKYSLVLVCFEHSVFWPNSQAFEDYVRSVAEGFFLLQFVGLYLTVEDLLSQAQLVGVWAQ